MVKLLWDILFYQNNSDFSMCQHNISVIIMLISSEGSKELKCIYSLARAFDARIGDEGSE